MPGQATVTIRDKAWIVAVVTTLQEVTSGLSGLPGLSAGTGMLFDLGADQDYIPIDMSLMLFNLDIVFINSQAGVSGVLHNVAPGDAAAFQASAAPGARYFLEVNAGEAADVVTGDAVVIQGAIQPSFWQYVTAALIMIPMVIPVFKQVARELKPE